MGIAILKVGALNLNILGEVEKGLSRVFPDIVFTVLDEVMQIPLDAYNSKRKQFDSSRILVKINGFGKKQGFEHVLGITDVDLFAPYLNFVFGEAEYGGRAAVISTFRLRPEFYCNAPDERLLVERVVKEAMDEIRERFRTPRSEGTFQVAYFLAPEDEEARERIQGDAYITFRLFLENLA